MSRSSASAPASRYLTYPLIVDAVSMRPPETVGGHRAMLKSSKRSATTMIPTPSPISPSSKQGWKPSRKNGRRGHPVKSDTPRQCRLPSALASRRRSIGLVCYRPTQALLLSKRGIIPSSSPTSPGSLERSGATSPPRQRPTGVGRRPIQGRLSPDRSGRCRHPIDGASRGILLRRNLTRKRSRSALGFCL